MLPNSRAWVIERVERNLETQKLLDIHGSDFQRHLGHFVPLD